VIELCDFLKDKNMITRLNLKRNKITNVGAKMIAIWLNDHDQSVTSIDLTRNKITRAGGEALLASLKRSTRIIDF
jgi:Ran GTPase-activating protein (RanGAP) involved in mRNA processing and transport